MTVRRSGYNPLEYYQQDSELKAIIDAIASGQFSQGDSDLFRPIVDSLLQHDEYMLLADFRPYVECCERAAQRTRPRLDGAGCPSSTRPVADSSPRTGRFVSTARRSGTSSRWTFPNAASGGRAAGVSPPG